MNSFNSMAEAQLMAAEGQRQLATALIQWIANGAARLLETMQTPHKQAH